MGQLTTCLLSEILDEEGRTTQTKTRPSGLWSQAVTTRSEPATIHNGRREAGNVGTEASKPRSEDRQRMGCGGT